MHIIFREQLKYAGSLHLNEEFIDTGHNFWRETLLKLHFKVLYPRRVLFVMSIVYYFGDQNS